MLTQWEAQGNTLVMTIRPDGEFLRNAQYPVTIDPTVQSGQGAQDIGDTFISEANPTVNYSASQTLLVGSHVGYGRCKALIQFKNLPKLPDAYTIAKAWLAVAVLPTAGNQENAYLYAHEMTGLHLLYTETVTWEDDPNYDKKQLDYTLIEKDAAAKRVSLDITNLVRSWYRRNGHYNVLLDSLEEQPVTLCSSENTTNNAPVLYINHVSNAGLEGYLSYESFGAGRAGTAHVALHSGHPTVTRGLTAMNGNRMPISLGLAWNACDKDKNTFGVGKGWRLNWNQSLRMEQLVSGDYYYMLTDEDGAARERVPSGHSGEAASEREAGLEASAGHGSALCADRKPGIRT